MFSPSKGPPHITPGAMIRLKLSPIMSKLTQSSLLARSWSGFKYIVTSNSLGGSFFFVFFPAPPNNFGAPRKRSIKSRLISCKHVYRTIFFPAPYLPKCTSPFISTNPWDLVITDFGYCLKNWPTYYFLSYSNSVILISQCSPYTVSIYPSKLY